MNQELPPNGNNVYVKDPNGNWEIAMYIDGVWTKGVENDPNDIPLDYEPVEWKYM